MAVDTALGDRVRRVDGADKLTGLARFTGDLQLPGMLHGRLLLSPYAHARIRAVDPSAALAQAGVVAVVTAALASGRQSRTTLKSGSGVVPPRSPITNTRPMTKTIFSVDTTNAQAVAL